MGMKAILLLCGCAAALGAQGVWERRAPYPVRVTEVSAATLNGKIYAICGILPDGSRTSTLYIYDPFLDEWAQGPAAPIPGGADHCNVAAAAGKLYVLGGIRVGTAFADGTTYEYDPASNQWTTVARMNEPRGASGVAVIGNKVYVAGGLSGTRSVASFEVFDADTRQWTRLPDMPTARDHLTAQAIGGKFYAIAGRVGGNNFRANEEYDPATNVWRARAAIPTARGGLGSGTLRNRIQVFGGEGPSGRPESTFEQNEEYDPVSDTWASLTLMRAPRHGLYGATFEGRIFTPGGGPIQGGSFSDTHEAFLLPLPNPPVIGENGVRNAASFRPELAPGALIAVGGLRFSQGEQLATRFPILTEMNATSVRVNGIAVPIVYAGPTQVNVQLPYNLIPGPARVTVTHAGSTSAEFLAPDAAPTAPGLFSMTGSGEGQGAITITNTRLVARSPADDGGRPARRGEFVVIFATGLGRLDFPPRTGDPAPSNPPARTLETPELTVGGVAAVVDFSGLTPGSIGLYQINTRVPESSPAGSAVPVVVRIGGRTSNTVTMAVE
jgi:uncharacterized protein (TIGR03437 family)